MAEEAVLVFVFTNQDQNEIEARKQELKDIVISSGAHVAAIVSQEVSSYAPQTLIGSGKVSELAELVKANGWDLVIFEESLTGSQRKNLQDAIDAKILDRVDVILDIFAQRARTKKAKLEVHLAQLEYRLPRLRGYGESLSRLGGGVGTRGPGEQKLETDRRAILSQVKSIKAKLNKLSGQAAQAAEKRRSGSVPLVALVGYTNVGKSTLMNRTLDLFGGPARSDKDVYADDRLFATLDTATRRIQREGEPPFLLVDTVGFIHDLPDKLLPSFESTLSEAESADLLLVLIDASNPAYEEEINLVTQTLRKQGDPPPILFLMNKSDLARPPLVTDRDRTLRISAKDPESVEGLVDRILVELYGEEDRVHLLLPYEAIGNLQAFRDQSQVIREWGDEEGLHWWVRTRERVLDSYLKKNPALERRKPPPDLLEGGGDKE